MFRKNSSFQQLLLGEEGHTRYYIQCSYVWVHILYCRVDSDVFLQSYALPCDLCTIIYSVSAMKWKIDMSFQGKKRQTWIHFCVSQLQGHPWILAWKMVLPGAALTDLDKTAKPPRAH